MLNLCAPERTVRRNTHLALVLTAIVISFGMTAVVVMMALGAFVEGGDDRIDMPSRDAGGAGE